MINKNSKIYIAGHSGMVGSALLRIFQKKKFQNIITRSRKRLDLLDQNKTFSFLKKNKPDAVIIAAAKVGGIKANDTYRADFLYENLQIQNNLIHGSYLSDVKNLLFLGSSCIYPKNCKQPIKEQYLLTSSLEKTNEPYAIAKISGLKMIESYNLQYKKNYLCLMPCNLYGPNDNYDLENSHFLPAIIQKIYMAKILNEPSVSLWGDGSPKREIMHVDDLADSCLHFLRNPISENFINIGSGEEYTIKKFAQIISSEINYKGKIKFDTNMPNGTQRKILDSSLAKNLNWEAKIEFKKGLKSLLKQINFLKK